MDRQQAGSENPLRLAERARGRRDGLRRKAGSGSPKQSNVVGLSRGRRQQQTRGNNFMRKNAGPRAGIFASPSKLADGFSRRVGQDLDTRINERSQLLWSSC